jgi:hypothetical protein
VTHLDRLKAKQNDARPATSGGPDSDQQAHPITTELPPLEVVCDYRNIKVALLIDVDDIPALVAHPLLSEYVDQIHAAAAAAEQEIDIRSRIDRDRQILRGVR